ncbi:hypothetical protein [uncultured Clostridium sp.]|uniref:hypothetical protein n=1 Tax=uncultured Clostridium sp. TaxID=59620 RepID=UPI0025D96577|nr:hypothetical protein [uncultured Clostridium sp.]
MERINNLKEYEEIEALKYFEVKGKYRAIIIAKTEEEAKAEYKNKIGKLEEEASVKEIDELEALKRHQELIKACAEECGTYVMCIDYSRDK